jgi:CHAT domain-containing protein
MRPGRAVCTVALCIAGVVVACASPETEADSGYLPNQLAAPAPLTRAFAPRLSIPTRHAECRAEWKSGVVPPMTCEGSHALPTQGAISVTAQASNAIRQNVDPADLHTVALSDIIWDSGKGKTLDRSITYLSMASNSAGPNTYRVLSDLSAALLLRAERSQDVRDVFQAIEAADSALRMNASSLSALFNLALGLETAGIDEQAIATWRKYLANDSDSPWSSEAQLHLSRLQSARTAMATKPASRSIEALKDFGRSSPQSARLFGWNVLLPEWGRLILANRIDSANAIVNQVKAIGLAQREARGDQTLNEAVEAIERTRDDSTRRTLARAHVDYAAAIKLYQPQRSKSAALFESAWRQSGSSKPLQQWAGLYRAATLVYDGQVDSGLSRMMETYATSSEDDAALKATASWMIGTTLIRQGQYEKALGRFVVASTLFTRCGENENATIQRLLAADAQFKVGDAIAAYATVLEALRNLRGYEPSVWTHSILAVLAAAASADGLYGAALRLQTEGLSAAESLHQPIYEAEARLGRARIAIAADRELARRDVDSAAAIISRTGDPNAQRWFRADLSLARAETAKPGLKRTHLRSLDSAFVTFDSLKNKIRILETLLARADAFLDAGRISAARTDLSNAASLVRSEHDAITSAVLRQSILSLAQDVFARAVLLAVAEGDSAGALTLLEQSRSTFSPGGTRYRHMDALSRFPAGMTALNYLAVSDTLLIWVVNAGGTHLVRRSLGGFQVEDSVTQLLSSLESGSGIRSKRLLNALSNQLISPISAFINNGDQLVMIGGGWISATPFAALRDASKDRYLIEDHAIAFASSMLSPSDRQSRNSARRALVVSDPTLPANQRWATIKDAASEGSDVAAIYPGASVLTKDKATPVAALNAVSKASVFHFAGHAVADPLRPMDSYLALSPSLPGDSSGRLTAEMIQRSRLNNVQLVVLSACETVRPSHLKRGETGALPLAFLAAGAKEVVGSTWRVEDRATRQLLTEFHRTYAQSGDAVDALRDSQIGMIRSSQAAMASPAAWAGFHVQVH